LAEAAHVAEDIGNLRLAYPEDAAFAAAIAAVAVAVAVAVETALSREVSI
jgi:hypothetical protein